MCRRDDGEWRSTGFDSVAVDRVTGLTIANAEIDAASARDAHHLQAGDDDDSDSD